MGSKGVAIYHHHHHRYYYCLFFFSCTVADHLGWPRCLRQCHLPHGSHLRNADHSKEIPDIDSNERLGDEEPTSFCISGIKARERERERARWMDTYSVCFSRDVKCFVDPMTSFAQSDAAECSASLIEGPRTMMAQIALSFLCL